MFKAALPAMVLLLSASFASALDLTSVDIDTQVAGSTTDNGSGSYTIQGAGSDIWDQADHFRFAYKQFVGDFDCRVRVSDLDVTDSWSKAGIQLRASTDGNSIHASIFSTGQNGFAFQHRDSTGGWSSWAWGGWNSPPNSWVRLVRAGNLVTGLVSNDNLVWHRVDSLIWSGTDPVLLGMAVTSHNPSVLCKAEFRNFSIQSPPGPVNGFSSIDINTGIEGSTVAAGSDGFDISASGWDLWNTQDSAREIYKVWNGDFDCRVRVAALEVTDSWSKAGIGVRSSTDPGSAHATMLVSGSNGFRLQHRDETNGASYDMWGGWNSPPNSWVRLLKVGSVITGFTSSDGNIWYRVGSINWTSSDPVLLGMVLSARPSRAGSEEFQASV